jgi:integrase
VGQGTEARQRFDDARRLARALGFDYAPADELARREISDLLDRVEALVKRDTVDDPAEVTALIGLADRPTIQISDLPEKYEALNKAALAQMSPDQVRKWKERKDFAVSTLIDVVGDKALDKLNRTDALDYRDWWQGRVVSGEVAIGTANKNIGALSRIIRTIDTAFRLELPPVFSKLRLEGQRAGKRAAFSPEFVQKRLFAPGILADLNDEARRVIYLVAETGLRLSEAVNLTENTIHLGGDVPYVSVAPEGRMLKTEQSERHIPLVGAALAVMKLQPKGFPRYRDRAASLSGLVNQVLDRRDLRPTKKHTLYSLRHTFEDRLTAVEAPEKVIATLMGHKWYRPPYGVGPSLEQKRDWMLRIAFDPPLTV